MKPKLLAFIPTSNELQRFVLGRAFAKLQHHFDVVYVLPKSASDSLLASIPCGTEKQSVLIFDNDPERFKAWSKLFKLGCYQYAHKSRSFALRINSARYAGPGGAKQLARDYAKYGGWTANGDFLGRVARKLFRYPATSADTSAMHMFNFRRYQNFRRSTLAHLGRYGALETFMAEQNPVAVLIPSSLLDEFCNDVVWAAREIGIPSIVLQSGWDNLSSKGILHHLPDFMGVWGAQSRRHAIEIQGMQKDQIVHLGAPHYESLLASIPSERARIRAALNVPIDSKLVMFGGSFRQFDETAALRELDAHIEAMGLACKIVYRPHPYRLDRKGEADFFEISWRHIVFDPEMQERYRRSKEEVGYIKRERPIYSMENLAMVISATDAVISPMSTLLLEAMILGKPSMAIAFSDDQHVYSAAAASEMTHFDVLKECDPGLIWCSDRRKFLSEFDRLIARPADQEMRSAQADIIDNVVVREPKCYADRLFTFVADTAMPAILNDKRQNIERAKNISHYYSADKILQNYVGRRERTIHVPGYWMHGWLPEYFNRHYALIALHKRLGVRATDQRADLELEKRTEFQWVSRPDQAEYLAVHGYKKTSAIGLPFAYLPSVNVERRAGSLLVMPPHGRKEYFRGNALAEAYVSAILSIKEPFSEIFACVTERDYVRGEWRQVFQDAGIPVIIGSNHSAINPLLRLKTILSRFEYVTTNAFGSHIAYAAHCGAKVSVFGPYCEWREGRRTYAAQMFPELSDLLVNLQSEKMLKLNYPFLFGHPMEAVEMMDWGDREIGLHVMKSPPEIVSLFG